MSTSLLSQGLELLLYGMGTVVVFLTLLVYATRLMSRLILRFFPEPVTLPRRAPTAVVPESPSVSPELLAAIAAAVHQHRAQRAARAETS